MILNELKKEDNNIYLFILFSMTFVFQICREIFNNYSYTHIILLGLQTILILMYIIFSPKNNNKDKSIEKLIILYCLYIIITFITRIYLGFNFKKGLLSISTDATSILVMILYYYLIIRIPLKNKDIKIMLMTFFYWTLLFILYSIIFEYNQFILAFTSPHAYGSSLESFFQNRNGFGFFLFVFYSIFLTQYEYYKSKIGSFKYYSIFIIIIFFILMTLSRTSILSTILFTSLCIMIRMKKHTKKIKYKPIYLIYVLITILIIIFMICFLFKNTQIVDFILHKVIRFDYKTTGRANIWKNGIEAWKKNKLFGIGSFETNTVIEHITFHNVILEVLVRNGLVGLIFKLSILISFISYHLVRNLNYNIEKKRFIVLGVSVFFALQFESILLFKIGIHPILLLFSFFMLIKTVESKLYN